MNGISGGGIQFDTVPVVNVDYRYNPSKPTATAVQVDPAQVKAFAAELIGAAPAVPQVTVDVSNASPKEGLAARVSSLLTGKGFAQGTTGTVAARKTSLVRFPPDLAAAGAEIARQLGGLATQVSSAVPAGHVEVVLGQVYSGPGVSDGGGAPGGPPPISPDGDNCVD
ncbi:LytR C-terminal domain-containing protein [Amycolatopsis sp. NPDC059657]|uniref:LytR C-terminal domain-containing protein n=1 Tax=Amycolatopsis sp. NPDC059657 TaxID=3346899 RepID=UPI00366F744C